MTTDELRILATCRAIGGMTSVAFASPNPGDDGRIESVSVALASPLGFNALNHFVSLSEPKPEFGEWVACGWLAGVPVRVSLPGGAL